MALNEEEILTEEDIRNMRQITGLSKYYDDDNEPDFRQQIIDENPEQAQQWLDKGEITPYERLDNAAKMFTGTYNNIDNNAHLTALGNAAKNSTRNIEVDNRIEIEKKKKELRNKRVNEGTASLTDRIGAALDRWGNEAYEINKSATEKAFEDNEKIQGVNREDKTKRYEITGYDRLGMPMYREIDLLDKIGFLEASRNSIVKGTMLGAVEEFADTKKERNILERIYNNEPIRQDELDFINRRVNEEREKIVRGYSTLGKLGEAVGYSVGFSADIIAGSALFKAIGGGALAAKIGTSTTSALTKANAAKKVADVTGNVAKWGVESLGGAATATAVNPFRTLEKYQGRMLDNEIEITDNGVQIFAEAREKPATAFFKSLAEVYIGYFTEMGGGAALSATARAAGKATRYATAPVTGKLFAKYPKLEKLINSTTTAFAKKYEEINKMPIIGTSTGWIKDNAHFDGFLEECGEEALEDVLNRIVGTHNEERNLKGFASDIFKTPEEWMIIAGAIAIQGGGLSAVSYALGNNMAERGINPEQIEEVLSTASQSEQKQILDELKKSGDVNMAIDKEVVNPGEKSAEQINVERVVFEKFSQGGKVQEEQAQALALLFGQFYKKAGSNTEESQKVFNEWLNKLEVRYNVPVGQKEPLKGGIEYNENGKFAQAKTLFKEVYDIVEQNKELPSYEEAYKYSDAGFGFLRDVISDTREMYDRHEQAVEDVNKYYDDKIGKAKTETKKEKLSAERETKLNEVQQTLENTRKMLLDRVKNFYNEAYKEPLYQSAQFAGANENEIEEAKREWNEKGAESKYFKKWFGNSKVVDENGKPLVVYHGSPNDFEIFETNAPDGVQAIYFTSSKTTAKSYADEISNNIYSVYLKIETPLIVDAHGKDYNDFMTEIRSNLSYAQHNGYDGLIIRNIKDNINGTKGRKADTYVVFNPEQIKSVKNEGTFDENNPNIYYQIDTDSKDDINQRTDKTKYLTDNEVEQLKKDKENFTTYIGKLLKNELKPETQIRVLQKLPSAYNFISALKGKKVVITQDIYKKIIDLPNKFKKNHFVDRKRAIKLPELISDPLYILQSTSEGNEHRYVVVTNTKGKNPGEKLSVIIEPKNNAIVVSAYDEVINISEEKKAGRVLYDKKKELSKTTIASKARTIDNSTNIITNSEGNLNPNVTNHEGKTFFQSAYHGTPHKFDNFSLEHIGTGEGAQAHGWGLYFAENKDISDGYRAKLVSRSMNGFNEYTFSINGEPIEEDLNFFLSNNLNGGVLYNAANTENAESQKELIDSIKWHIDYLRRGDASTVRLINMLQEAIDKIESNPKISITKFLDEVPEYEKYRFKTLVKAAEREAKEEGQKANIQYLLKWIKEQQKPFLEERNKQLSTLEKLEKLDIDNIKISRRTGQLFEVDIPENDVLLDEDKHLQEQDENVQKIINKILDENDWLKDEFKNFAPTGKDLYKALVKEFILEQESRNQQLRNFGYKEEEYQDPKKQASEFLNNYGIKGITYDGRQDGRCYVIFDDKAIEVLKTYYQENFENESDDRYIIAGFPYIQIMEKLTALNEETLVEKDEKKLKELFAQIHVLEDAYEIFESENSTEREKTDIALKVYYVMNGQKIPDHYAEDDANTQRTISELIDIHKKRKEKAAEEYYGYFTEGKNKNVITIMANANASTALHELGHVFLNGLNELAKVDENARKMLDEVNKKLGVTNGVYTQAQAEKFARSFEAYLYSGKSPNAILRRVFENFKGWLKAVYHYVTDIPGADISEEVQEMFDKMFGDDSYYTEQKQAKELLADIKKRAKKKNVEKVEVVDDKALDETSKRHKEVCYEILSAATGKSAKYLKSIFETASDKKGVVKKREAIQELLDKTEDKISSNNGFQQNWAEFFADPGTEAGADAQLAYEAFERIINKNWKKDNQYNSYLDEQAKYYARTIDESDRAYKLLLSEYKKGNRNVVLAAIYDFTEQLPEDIREDYENRFMYDARIIERYENETKFEAAKRKILQKALELQNRYAIDKDKEFDNYKTLVLETMKNLDFLQPNDKAKLTANILDISSVEMLSASIDNIMDIAATMDDVRYRRSLESEIHKELQGTKNVKKNGRTVGKYNYHTNKIFEELRRIDRLSVEQAERERENMLNYARAEDSGISYEEKLYNKFLSYKAGGRTFQNTEMMKSIYDEIVRLKLIGKTAKSELELLDKFNETQDIDELIDLVQNKKAGGLLIKSYISGFGNLESALNAIFDKTIKEKYGSEILYAETQAQAWQHQQKQKFERAVAKIYNLPEWNWDKKIIEYLSQKKKFPEIRRRYDDKGQTAKTRLINREMTKMDIIAAYIYNKNKVLSERLKNQFGEDTLYAMFEELTSEDIKLAQLCIDTAESFYNLVNKAFIDKYGVDLSKISCYFPSTPERGSEVDLYNEYSSKSLNQGFTKSRSGSELIPMDFHNPIATLFSHIEGVAKFSYMSESLDRANIRFKNTDLKRAIIDKYGEDAYRTLEQSLINVSYKKEAAVFSGINKILNNLTSNWIQGNVNISPMVGLKQLLSASNYSVDMPYMTWQIGFLKAIMNFKGTINYMMQIPYIKARFEGGLTNEFLKQVIENSAYAKTKKLKDLCSIFIKTGDIGAIIFGGKPYIDYLIKERGMSEEEAIKQFILSTNRSQQSSAISSLSNFQVAATRNPIGSLFIAYKNSPQQYIRMCGDAIVSAANGDITKPQCIKMLWQFGYLQPFLYAVASSGALFRLFLTGDWDDLLKDMEISLFNLGSDSLPIVGDIYKYALNKMMYKQKYTPQTTPMLGDIETEIARISKDDVSASDYLQAISYIGLHVGAGYNTRKLIDMSTGAYDITQGDVAKGSLKIIGYTDKRAEHITK